MWRPKITKNLLRSAISSAWKTPLSQHIVLTFFAEYLRQPGETDLGRPIGLAKRISVNLTWKWKQKKNRKSEIRLVFGLVPFSKEFIGKPFYYTNIVSMSLSVSIPSTLFFTFWEWKEVDLNFAVHSILIFFSNSCRCKYLSLFPATVQGKVFNFWVFMEELWSAKCPHNS